MIVFLTCKGYQVIGETTNDCDAPAECLRLEQERNDGYAVVASRDGVLVADAGGWMRTRHGPPPYDAATATGMYD